MKTLRFFTHSIRSIGRHLAQSGIGAYSALASFFIIVSVVPFTMILLTLLQFLPLSQNGLLDVSMKYLPSTLAYFFSGIINDIYNGDSKAVISIALLTALWSASKGVHALVKGLSAISGVKAERKILPLRIISILYTLIILVMLVVMMVFLVFGSSLFAKLESALGNIQGVPLLIFSLRALLAFVILTFFFLLLYILVLRRQTKIKYELPGAVISAVGWIGFSYLYSFYVRYIAGPSIYGSLTAIVLFMLWLYFCMYILLFGAEVNQFVKKNVVLALRR